MRSGNLPRRFLVRFFLLVFNFALVKAGKHPEYYQDVEPERGMEINYEEMVRYPENVKGFDAREETKETRIRSDLPLYVRYQDHLRREAEKLIHAMSKQPKEIISSQLTGRYALSSRLAEMNDEEQRSLDFPQDRFEDYANFKSPYAKNIFRNGKSRYYENLGISRAVNARPASGRPDNDNFEIKRPGYEKYETYGLVDENLGIPRAGSEHLEIDGPLDERLGINGPDVEKSRISEAVNENLPIFRARGDKFGINEDGNENMAIFQPDGGRYKILRPGDENLGIDRVGIYRPGDEKFPIFRSGSEDLGINPLESQNRRIVRPVGENLEKNSELYQQLMHTLREYVDVDNIYANENEPLTKSPEFTYRLDNSNLKEKNIFAVKPDDPRFYEDEEEKRTEASETEIDDKITSQREVSSNRVLEGENEAGGSTVDTSNDFTTEETFNDKYSIMKLISPEAQRRVDDFTVVSATPIANNDVYFIAIVAGCSAAAMFALVLISLTWCRLQRGAKAAADIEYPAYGVTGPNKDISPSGDQRLAHSAQMYHFQHQKQQIIAMEKTAASRDPGSVSEAESDEENEEGDYTVYECPGLASAGEMEVKNPMFNEVPTPATPPRIHKEEDH